MSCGDCTGSGASACTTCNLGYQLATGGGACNLINNNPGGGLTSGSNWLWWDIGIVVVCLIIVAIVWFVMRKGKEASHHSDNIEMHVDTHVDRHHVDTHY